MQNNQADAEDELANVDTLDPAEADHDIEPATVPHTEHDDQPELLINPQHRAHRA